MVSRMERLTLQKEVKRALYKLPNDKVVIKITRIYLNDLAQRIIYEFYVVED